MGNDDRRPQVAVAVFLLKEESSCVLLGRRLSSIGQGSFALPGGRLEFGESFEECARREVKEETGMDVDQIDVLTVVNSVGLPGPNPTHFVTVIVRAEMRDPSQMPANLEPDKCGGWDWYQWAHLPEPLFGPLQDLLNHGFHPFLRAPLQI